MYILILFSLLTAVIWRAEIEFHGYAGLTWIKYFHWSIPIGFLVFLGWLTYVSLPYYKNVFEGVTKLTGTIVYLIMLMGMAILVIPHFFIIGPRVFVIGTLFPSGGYVGYIIIKTILPLFYFVIVPFLLSLTGYWIGYTIDKGARRLGFIVYYFSFPLALALLSVVGDKGNIDLIHTIKNGTVVPFLFIAFALMLLPTKKLL